MGTHETDGANGIDEALGLGFRFHNAPLEGQQKPYQPQRSRAKSGATNLYRDPICHRLKIQPTMVSTMLMRMQVASGK